MTQTGQSLDHILHTTVTNELSWTPAVDQATVGVSVLSGVVTLAGEVQTYAEKQAALAVALGVPGVRAVADALVVHHQSDRPSDSRIAIAASEALQNAESVPPTVQATVRDRTIMLSGIVSWDLQRAAARRAVEKLPGVLGVWSTMTITRQGLAAPAEAAGRAALHRTAALDADGIEVPVAGEEVTVAGTTESAAQRQRADKTRRTCPGASPVKNRPTVR